MHEEKLLGLRADLQVGGRGFGKFSEVSTIFSTIFSEFSTIFFRIFCDFLENFPKNFCNFFRLLRFPYDFSENFSENSRSQSVTVQPGSRHYCKFTSKFTSRITPKFTLMLIKILQSTKFEGSHFFNSLATFTAIHNLLRPPKTLPFAAAFSQPQLRRAKGTNGRPSPCDGGGMWAIRGIISRITSLIVSRLTSQRPGRKPTKNQRKPKPLSRSPFHKFPFPIRQTSKYL